MPPSLTDSATTRRVPTPVRGTPAAANATPVAKVQIVRPQPVPAANQDPTIDSAVTSPRAKVPRRPPTPGTPQPAAPTRTKPLVIPKPGTQEFDDQRTVLYRPAESTAH
jgi:hypothetical protein